MQKSEQVKRSDFVVHCCERVSSSAITATDQLGVKRLITTCDNSLQVKVAKWLVWLTRIVYSIQIKTQKRRTKLKILLGKYLQTSFLHQQAARKTCKLSTRDVLCDVFAFGALYDWCLQRRETELNVSRLRRFQLSVCHNCVAGLGRYVRSSASYKRRT